MAATEFDVVDLGTKRGEAIRHFLAMAGKTMLPATTVSAYKAARCVGYERPEAEAYRAKVEALGYRFQVGDLTLAETLQSLPTAEVYLAWHVLEHLPNKEFSTAVVQVALSKACRLAWFRLPSFEPDEQTGEGVLRKLGLRFTWTFWLGHPTAWLISDCRAAIKDWAKLNPDRKFDLVVKPAGYIKSTDDRRVVPISAPVDTNYYQPEFGPKPAAAFKPAIVSEWEVVVKFK